MNPKKVKDLPEDTRLDTVKVKLPYSWVRLAHVPRRNYYYIYSLTGFTVWVKTRKSSDRVYPISMLGSIDSILNLSIYYRPKKK